MSDINLAHLVYGYTTGTHTTAIVKSAIELYCNKINESKYLCKTPLANGELVDILVNTYKLNNKLIVSSTKKTYNDDYDVSKGCIITCYIIEDYQIVKKYLSKIKHKPYIIELNSITTYIYAGKGLGIVSKPGLKALVGYPAINPVPLSTITKVIKESLFSLAKAGNIYIVISIDNGEELANKTANPKVGVIGGLSILGSTGIVKPLSIDRYLKSIKSELLVAKASGIPTIVYTIGNTANNFAKTAMLIPNECFIEIGNFIHKSISLLSEYSFRELYIISGPGKMAKIAQGFDNTHNRNGFINFNVIIDWIIDDNPKYSDKLYNKSFNTIREMANTLASLDKTKILKKKLYLMLCHKALKQIELWFISPPNNRVFGLDMINIICLDEVTNIKYSKSYTKV